MTAQAPAGLQRELASESDTLALGAALARSLPRNARDALVVYLQGELGSGKTTLARAVLRELGAQGTVRSPSYTLVESYQLGAWQALHLDLYRLREAAELEQLALRDELRAGVLLMVEWPERAPLDLPDPDLRILLSTLLPAPLAGEDETVEPGRQAQLSAGSPIGEQWLAGLSACLVSRTEQS